MLHMMKETLMELGRELRAQVQYRGGFQYQLGRGVRDSQTRIEVDHSTGIHVEGGCCIIRRGHMCSRCPIKFVNFSEVNALVRG